MKNLIRIVEASGVCPFSPVLFVAVTGPSMQNMKPPLGIAGASFALIVWPELTRLGADTFRCLRPMEQAHPRRKKVTSECLAIPTA